MAVIRRKTEKTIKIPLMTILWDFVPYHTRRRIWSTIRVFSIVVSVVSAIQFTIGTIQFKRALEETESSYPKWRWDSLEAARKTIPDSENSAIVLLESKKHYNRQARPSDEIEISDSLQELVDYPNCKSRPEQREQIIQLLAPHKDAIAFYQKIKEFDSGRLPLTESTSFLTRILPEITPFSQASEGLRYEALKQIETGDAHEAIDSMLCGFAVCRAMGDHPTAIAMVIRSAGSSRAVQNIERLLAQVPCTDESLARLQHALEREASEPLLKRMVVGERAIGFQMYEEFKAKPSLAWQTEVAGNVDLVALSQRQAQVLRSWNSCERMSKLPLFEINAFCRSTNRQATMSVINFDPYASFAQLTLAESRRQAILGCNVIAIAAERFRLKNQRWPKSVDELVATKFLNAKLIDPYDGQPVRWKEFPEGRLIYSIGPDFADNGGEYSPEKRWKPGSDNVIRLFDLPQRGLPPRPAPKKDGTNN